MKLLLVDDEPAATEPLVRALRERGHEVDAARSLAAALDRPLSLPPDLVVLDRSLPDGDGLELVVGWRRRGLSLPVIVVSARARVEERREGLRAGADDYVARPFDLDELVLRIEALHRRANGREPGPDLGAGVRLDPWQRALVGGAGSVPLTSREFGLVAELASHPGEVLSRSDLLQRVWGGDFDGLPNVVDVYVGYLRAKLDRAGAAARIETVRGAGYRLLPPG